MFAKPSELVVSAATGEALTDPETLRSEISRCAAEATPADVIADAAKDLDCLIEIGPDRIYTDRLRSTPSESRTLYVALDDAADQNRMLENLTYRKYFNRLYAAKRMLGTAACTQNYSDAADTDRQISEAYQFLRTYVDDAERKRYEGQTVEVTDSDLERCAEELKTILRLKQVPAQEICQRIVLMEEETALRLRPYFSEWF